MIRLYSVLLCGALIFFPIPAHAKSSRNLVHHFEPGKSWVLVPGDHSGIEGMWEAVENKTRQLTLHQFEAVPAKDIEKSSLKEITQAAEEARAAVQEPFGIRKWRIRKLSRTRLKRLGGWMLEWEGTYLGVDGASREFLERQFVIDGKTWQVQAIWNSDDRSFGIEDARTAVSRFSLEARK